MDQIGFISRIEGNNAQVIVRRVSSCGDKCGSCQGGCNVPGVSVSINNTLGAKAGDYVEVRMDTKTVLKSAFLVYIIPLAMLIVGIASGIQVFNSMGYSNYEALGFITGLGFLGLSFLILRVIDKVIKEKQGLKFEMTKVLDE